MIEQKRRSLLKSLSWRFFATLITISVAYYLTGETKAALEIGLVDTLIKFFAYYGHERTWGSIRFGLTPESKQGDNYQI